MRKPLPMRTTEQHISLHQYLIEKAEKEIEAQKKVISESEKAIKRLTTKL
tara:strand:- start:937 stop:1086 length:150 start_codon:yes stop_codon:yes gene_type:complete